MTLTEAELAATVDSIAAVQLGDGMIPRFPRGPADPWNHVEAAMALTVGGRVAEAEAAFEWLVATQRPDGAWHQYYRRGPCGPVVDVALLDANVTAYVATGVWHHFLATADRGFVATMWPVVERAVGFVLALQAPGGEIVWARHADGRPWPFALLTASSSTCFSLRCASALAATVGAARRARAWAAAADAVADAVANRPWAFLPKDRWAMDWYYPVLAGIVDGGAARGRLRAGVHRFVLDGLGVRCVADRPWVTAAESCEAAIAYAAAGHDDEARQLLGWVQHLRDTDGRYFTGMVHPERVHFPGGERTTYSAAAVVLATDALDASTPAARLFRHDRRVATSTSNRMEP
jgi:hypothetical protein